MISSFEMRAPKLGKNIFVAPSAHVMGQVELGDDVNIWYGCVLRGDVGKITVGARTNIQDLSVMHVTSGQFDTHIGANVTVGHRAILHGCTVHDNVLVGMGATVMDGVVVEPYCVIGAGALLSPGKRIPSGSLVTGAPGRVVRQLTDSERHAIDESAQHYVDLGHRHLTGIQTISL